MTLVSAQDIRSGRWRFNPSLAESLQVEAVYGQRQLAYYTDQLANRGKYDLTIWPYHAMLGGIGHALVPAVEEAVFFHSIARYSPTDLIIKGDNPFTEHYSAVGPEVTTDVAGRTLAPRNPRFLKIVQDFDAVYVAGQAKSHCVAWTLSDMLDDIQAVNPGLAGKVHLLEDCTSPVVVPGVVDYTEQAEAAFERLAAAGMHLVRSTDELPQASGT
jgi:nicotinamidase-related amidase